MDHQIEPFPALNEAPATDLSRPTSLFAVFFLDEAAASARLLELTDYAIAHREAGWTERAAISRAISLVIPRSNEATAAQCAQALSIHHAMDALTTEAFLARRDEAARIVLAESNGLSQRLSLQIAAIGSEDEARALTARTDLDDTVIHILLNRRDRPIDILLAENHGLPLSRLMLERMMTRAMIDPALCRSLFDRPDLTLKDRAGLFLNAANAQRLQLIDELAALFVDETGEPVRSQGDVLTTLETHLTAFDFAGFVNTAARVLQVDMFRLSIMLMEPTGAALIVLASLFGAPDHMIERMQRAWSRPAPHDTRKRHEMDLIKRGLTPAMAGFILDSILAIEISEQHDAPPQDDSEHAVSDHPINEIEN